MGSQERAISKKRVEHIADLARVALSEEEKELFTGQLNAVLDYFRLLDEMDTTGVPPMLSVLGLQNVWRRDEPRPCLSIDEALANVARKEKGYVKSPKIG